MPKGTVLIVDDNEMNLDIAHALLEDAGFNTVMASDAESGIRIAQAVQPDVILMDMHLPDKDGYEATRLLKSMPTVENIPVVAFTAQAILEEQERAMLVGCSGIISKPIDILQFSNQVEGFMTCVPSMSGLHTEKSSTPQISNQFASFKTVSFAKMAHDLKTPVAAEYHAFQLLLSGKLGPLTEKQQAMLEDMALANRDLSQMLNQLLEKFPR